MNRQSVTRYFPVLEWGRAYDRDAFASDFIAAIVVTIMLIPQSLAYALLAGLPAEMGLYASIAPIILYAIFGTSRALAVGPVAVISLMTASAAGAVANGSVEYYIAAAITLALLSGVMLLAMGVFRLGFIANFLSHPVIQGFITASGILIAISQVGLVLGIKTQGQSLAELFASLWSNRSQFSAITFAIGAASTAFLFWVRFGMNALLRRLGMNPRTANLLTKIGPIVAVIAATLLVWSLNLTSRGVAVVGAVPQSLPGFTWPTLDLQWMHTLLGPALLISIIGFVESVSVARTLAAKKRQTIDPDQELIGLGAANIGSSLTGGFPVTGGFARSVVNFDAGAATPAAGAFTAVGLAIAAVALTPLLFFLPKATLAATIIVAVLSLVDFSLLKKAWVYSKADFAAVAATIVVTLLLGVEAGVSSGVVLSIALFLYKTSRPHIAEVGLVAGTQHFRNIKRHAVITDPSLVTLRVDESLYFANTRFLEEFIQARVARDPALRNVVIQCSAINEIDMSALESLEAINLRLRDVGIGLHLSEVKGPVMDRLKKAHFLDELNGQVFLSQYDAFSALTKQAS